VAYLIAKVYYHLEDYQESVLYALEAGSFFDFKVKSTFTDCILSKGLDSYIQQKQRQYTNVTEPIDQKLEAFFERVF
jgi:26S proteasome regulatory subunit N2